MLAHFTLFFSLIVFTVLITWLDKKYQLGLSEQSGTWFDDNTQPKQQKPSAIKTLEEENQALRKRIEVLEKIVTEPSYELNKEINKL